jgi:dynein heavy chain
MQLYDQILVRHGVMLVGPTGGGKTISRNILQRALIILPTFMQDKNKTSGVINYYELKKFLYGFKLMHYRLWFI